MKNILILLYSIKEAVIVSAWGQSTAVMAITGKQQHILPEMHSKTVTHIIICKWLNSAPIMEAAVWGSAAFVCLFLLLFPVNKRKCHTLLIGQFQEPSFIWTPNLRYLYNHTKGEQTPEDSL